MKMSTVTCGEDPGGRRRSGWAMDGFDWRCRRRAGAVWLGTLEEVAGEMEAVG